MRPRGAFTGTVLGAVRSKTAMAVESRLMCPASLGRVGLDHLLVDLLRQLARRERGKRRLKVGSTGDVRPCFPSLLLSPRPLDAATSSTRNYHGVSRNNI